MGIGGISIWQLLIVLVIVVMIFGTKKLRNMGGDVGGAVKDFKKALKSEDQKEQVENGESSETINVSKVAEQQDESHLSDRP